MKRILASIMTAGIMTTATAGQVGTLTSFTAGTPAKAAEVNQNFQAIKDAVNNNDTRLGTVETNVGTLQTDVSARQSRVTGTCTVGSAISAINADGTVVCESFQKSGTAVLTPQDFRATSENLAATGDCQALSGDYNSVSGTLSSCNMLARLRLPDNATVTNFSCRVFDSTPNAQVSASLYSHSLQDASSISEVDLTSSTGIGYETILPINAGPYVTVDNSTYYYTVMIRFDAGSNSLSSIAFGTLQSLNCSVSYGY